MTEDLIPFCQAMRQHGYTLRQAEEAAAKFVRIAAARELSYPCTLPFLWGRRTHYITAERDSSGRLVLKRSSAT
jgi:hypothetical protein